MEDLIAEQDDLIDDVDLRLDRHVGGEDGEEELLFEGVDQVSICASTTSTNKNWMDDDDRVGGGVGGMGEGEEMDDTTGGGEGTGEGLKNLNLPMRPVEVHEFLNSQEDTRREEERED